MKCINFIIYHGAQQNRHHFDYNYRTQVEICEETELRIPRSAPRWLCGNEQVTHYTRFPQLNLAVVLCGSNNR